MSRKRKLSLVLTAALVIALAGSAVALATISFTLGTVASYDFGSFGPGYPIPASMQIEAFTMKPGDTIPWHYHKAPSYVILARGTLTEQHIVGPDQCASEELNAGSAFIEAPGEVHTVTNTGQDVAVICWSTVFPKDDGITQFSPEFKSGGVYPAKAPSCN
jgi:quercetin dioxygenase-like cupin family protein